MNWKFFVKMAIPVIENAGEMYIGKDENQTGKDDIIGQSLLYCARLLRAIVEDKFDALPKVPSVLK